MLGRPSTIVERLDADAVTIPTSTPESDGTLAWTDTTVVIARAHADGCTGIGWTYSDAAAASLIRTTLRSIVEGTDASCVQRTWEAMRGEARNLGVTGLVACAMSAVDMALWDLKARLLGIALADLWGPLRDEIGVYGSGGFTSYSVETLCSQLRGWVGEGLRMVKMKIGGDVGEAVDRVAAAREAVGQEVQLFVDANGAYDCKQAAACAEAMGSLGVAWFEEPVTSDDLEGLRMVRDRAPAGMDVTAGEYGYTLPYFERMAAAGAVDVLQADATRCGGFTGFLRVASLCEARCLPCSAHTAPNLHAHVCLAAPRVRHVEYFYDHVRIENELFAGALVPVDGVLRPDRARPGNGLQLAGDALDRWRGEPA